MVISIADPNPAQASCTPTIAPGPPQDNGIYAIAVCRKCPFPLPLLYAAAHLLDDVEDRDQPDAISGLISANQVISLATGFIFTAELVLARLEGMGVANQTAKSIRLITNQAVLRMASGQHLDLVTLRPSLEQCWHIAEAKSGEFFALACILGARLGTEDPAVLNGLSTFGRQLGIIKQIKDDWTDLWGEGAGGSDLERHKWSLPIAYALSVLSPDQANWISSYLENHTQELGAQQEARDLILHSGSLLYLQLEIKKSEYLASDALLGCCPPSSATEQLLFILRQAGAFKPNAAGNT